MKKSNRISLWAWTAFLLPAAALVYLFVWSQTSDPFSVQTEIQRAALSLEQLALEELKVRVDQHAEAACQEAVKDTGEGQGIYVRIRLNESGKAVFLKPSPPATKMVWPLPEEERDQYQLYMQEVVTQELKLKDLARAETVLKEIADRFTALAFKVRTDLARGAFLKRRGRLKEAEPSLIRMICETDPAAVPSPDDLPFVVAAFLILQEGKEGKEILPAEDRDGLIQAMASGKAPMSTTEISAVTTRLTGLAPEERRLLEGRRESLELMETLREHGEVLEKMAHRTPFALVFHGRLFLGGFEEGEARGVALAADTALASLLNTSTLTDPKSGLLLSLHEEGTISSAGEVIRTINNPAGIDGASLDVLLLNRGRFERSTASRKVFITSAAVFLILAMMVLGFATIKAVRREVEAAKARSDFMAAVSHELRTPLASIRMFAELMEEDRVEDLSTKQRFLRLILSNCQRLSAMIENVLDLSRSEQGLMRFHLEEVNIQKLLEDLFRDIRAVAEEEGFVIEVTINPDLPTVRADPTALARALFNLSDNAMKYSGEEKRIEVKAEAREEGVAISIRDHGAGVSSMEQDRIFQRFQRGDKGRALSSGAGLGLTLAREAVEACGGTIVLESREGEGATFTVLLPKLNKGEDPSREKDSGN
jgi:signal transduction histidine kinase